MSTDPSYTVFIRLPFPRGDFVDPPSVEWNATKEKALWKILSKASKNSDIDWDEQAIKFDVPLPFLLQQIAWIYERQLVQVRAQMRKVGQPKGTGSAAPSPVPGSTSDSAAAVGEAMRRTGSGGGIRGASVLSTRKDSPIPRTDGASSLGLGSGRAGAPPISRTSSANTTITTRNIPQPSPRPAAATLQRPTNEAAPKASHPPTSPSARSSSPASSDSGTSSSDSGPAASRIVRRPRFSNKLGQSEDADDDEDEPAFMPVSTTGTSSHDPSATLRGDPRNLGTKRLVGAHKKSMEVVQKHQRGMNSQTSDSSASSTAPPVLPRRGEAAVGKDGGRIGGGRGMAGPLSPKRTAELSGRGREGSEGSQSMGSSFSDLDDASVTQSALEEALASNMQHGGMASRMSMISQALRSKYF